MARAPLSDALKQFIDDELLRAPLLVEQAADGAVDQLLKVMPTLSAVERTQAGDLMQTLKARRGRLSEPFMASLREQVESPGAEEPPTRMAKLPPLALALVEEDAVEADVELSHTIEAIRTTAEFELRELGTYLAALAGDMDVAADHNPFTPEIHTRALWAAAQRLPVTRWQQVLFMRHAGVALANALRQSYAASCTRLETMGVEPAAYRTVIIPGRGPLRQAGSVTTYSPDLQRMRQAMPAEFDAAAAPQSDPAVDASMERWSDIARRASAHIDRQAVQLVSRLFEAILTDERVPADVNVMTARLHGPAMRLALVDGALLDRDSHPLWQFIHLLAYEAEMVPEPSDPERVRLLMLAQQLIDAIASDRKPGATLYRNAVRRLQEFLRQRLERRCAAAARQISALQQLEEKMLSGASAPSTMSGMIDLQGMDTVPADLINRMSAQLPKSTGEGWLESLVPGTWVRMFFNLHWVHAQLLWPGERGEIWLFGDGASNSTWAVRRGALMRMHATALAKTLNMRSLVGSAAARVQEQMAALARAA